MTQSELIRQIIEIAIKSKSRDVRPSQWVKEIIYFHKKGWLYTSLENKDTVGTVVVAYRIKEYDKEKSHIVPEKEEGNILYIPYIFSRSRDKMKLLRLAKSFFSKNKDIKEVVFEKDGNIKRIRVGEKEIINAEQKT